MELEESAKEEQIILGIKRNQQEIGKIYYITEASNAVKVENHVLRYWEDELGLPVRRNEQGHRYYTEEDIRMLRKIKRLKDQGLQLKAIKLVLKGMNYLPVEEKTVENKDVSESEKTEKKSYENKIFRIETNDTDQEKNEIPVIDETDALDDKELNRKDKFYDFIQTETEKDLENKTLNMNDSDYPIESYDGVQKESNFLKDNNCLMEKDKKEIEESCHLKKDSKKERSDGLMEKDNIETGRGGLDKLQKLRLIIKLIVRETLDEYMSNYRKEIQDVIAKEMDYQFRMWQEQQEEIYSGYDRKRKGKN